MLTITIYDGEIVAPDSLVHLCDVEGSAEAYDRPPFTALEEALRVLEMCSDRYSTPHLSGTGFTVFIGNKEGLEVTPLVRLDGYAHNGYASAGIVGAGPRFDTVPAKYAPDDDVVEIVRKILAGQVTR
ncbi:hypothetical protein [Paraburkholderia lycopersici]|uniref:Uncharacterized protein n=1 Tax=Paraburkholderia lycopersici TaxID=416944 RepID=A0A1G6Z1A0_9BURK|nr:hypothetical protein [Paraburkholderia lycopersici]SDD96524.1 hypothetical protein SAMN05421548_12949 [Paraburkholderia lycopersici]